MTSKTNVDDNNVEKYFPKGKFSTVRTKNIDHKEIFYVNTSDSQKPINRKISFKVKSASSTKRLENRMHITTLSASRVQELTTKFNKMCNNNNGNEIPQNSSPSSKLMTYHPRKLNAIMQKSHITHLTPKQILQSEIKTLNNLELLEPLAKRLEEDNKVIKIIKKPSVKRKPSFLKITPSKNISDTIKMFEQKVPSLRTQNKPSNVKRQIKSNDILEGKDLTSTNENNEIDTRETKITFSNQQNKLNEEECRKMNGVDTSDGNDLTATAKHSEINIHESKITTTICNNNDHKMNEEQNSTRNSQNLEPSNYEITNTAMSELNEISEPEKDTDKPELSVTMTKRNIVPNNSFLWRSRPLDVYDRLVPSVPEKNDDTIDTISITSRDSYQQNYETILAKTDALLQMYKTTPSPKPYVNHFAEIKEDNSSIHSYDDCSDNYENVDGTDFDNYEQVGAKKIDDTQSLYEQIGPERQENTDTKDESSQIPSPSPPHVDVQTLAEAIKRNSLTPSVSTVNKDDQSNQSNLYESIYISDRTSNRDSIISHDQQSNSLYGRWEGKTGSDTSYSDKSDDWIDITDPGKCSPALIIIRTPVKKLDKTWSDKVRCQREKSSSRSRLCSDDDCDSDHFYESVSSNEHGSDYDDDEDSFESDSDFERVVSDNQRNEDKFDYETQLPPTPESNTYSLSRLANRAGKHMQKLTKNWFLTKNDLTKSLGRITRKKSVTKSKTIEEGTLVEPFYENSPLKPNIDDDSEKTESSKTDEVKLRKKSTQFSKRNSETKIEYRSSIASNSDSSNEKRPKKKQWSVTSKFKRSVSISGESLATLSSAKQSLSPEKPKSTFYLYEIELNENTVDVDNSNSKDDFTDEKPNNITPIQQPQKSNSSSPTDDKKNKKGRSTSWYTDNDIYHDDKIIPVTKSSSACWYTESGLLPTSENLQCSQTVTYNESSDSFSSTTTAVKDDIESLTNEEKYYNLTNANKHQPYVKITDNPHKKVIEEIQAIFHDEPLYQFYTAEKVESGMRILTLDSWNEDDDSDGYEQIGENNSLTQSRPSAMQLIRPSSPGQTRTLWCEVPQVISSNLLNTLTQQQKKVQEAKFEIITSEASYLNSLNVLCSHFIQTIKSEKLLSLEDQNILFGNIEPVKKCAENLLADLENCWQDNILLHGICEILRRHATDHFSVYVTYCENQVYLEQTLKKVKEQHEQFGEVLNKLESSPVCQLLPLHSFLMLPMQRITRLPLLLDAILKRLHQDDVEYESCQLALATVNKVVEQCNEAARRAEQRDEFKRTWNKLEFPSTKPTVNSDQIRLIRSGEIIQLLSRGDDVKLTFGKKFIKIQLHLFLLTDLFIVAKRKGTDDMFNVIHYCRRNFIEVDQSNDILQVSTKDAAGKHLLFLTILENQEGRTIEMLLSCGTATDKQRWYEAFIPPVSQNPDEILYESWDCPQFMVLHQYIPQQPDELPLEKGDVVNVMKKMTDGWYFGERIRDGRSGWFPGNHVMEVQSPHVRARNLKQRYRLLALSRNFVESQKKK